MTDDDALSEIVLHGHRVFYRGAGEGPVIVMVHGITSTSATWSNVLPYLAEHFTVIAPDLLGHGESAKPRGDYSLGAYASGIRDLLVALGHERATFVGHSLGGGVAMQMAYQFPEHCERLVLVSSGGLGRGITPLLRAASLPGSELVLPLLVNDQLIGIGRAVGRVLGRARAAGAHGRRGGPARSRLAVGRRDALGVPAHAQGDRRSPGPARGRERSALPRPGDAVSDRVGRARSDHPGRARARGSRPGARAAGSSSSPEPGTSRISTTRCASSGC